VETNRRNPWFVGEYTLRPDRVEWNMSVLDDKGWCSKELKW
jgi:hypothetical protein